MGEEFRYILPDLFKSTGNYQTKYVESVQKERKEYEYLVNHHTRTSPRIRCLWAVAPALLAYKDIKVRAAVFEGCSLWEHVKLLILL